MIWQRNMLQMKEQEKTPEGQLSNIEIRHLLKKESRVMVMKIIQELEKRKDAQSKKVQEIF